MNAYGNNFLSYWAYISIHCPCVSKYCLQASDWKLELNDNVIHGMTLNCNLFVFQFIYCCFSVISFWILDIYIINFYTFAFYACCQSHPIYFAWSEIKRYCK